MQTQKYSIQQPLIESLLACAPSLKLRRGTLKVGEIAIPEIQRPMQIRQ